MRSAWGFGSRKVILSRSLHIIGCVAHLFHFADEIWSLVSRAGDANLLRHLQELVEVSRLREIELRTLLDVQLLWLFILRGNAWLFLQRLGRGLPFALPLLASAAHLHGGSLCALGCEQQLGVSLFRVLR